MGGCHSMVQVGRPVVNEGLPGTPGRQPLAIMQPNQESAAAQAAKKRPPPPNVKADEADACMLRGNDLVSRRQYEEALVEYNRAIKDRPNFPRAFVERGLCYKAMGKRAEAVKDLTSAINHDTKYLLAFKLRAELLMAQESYDKALRDYDAAIGIAPEDSELYKLRADCYRQMGDMSSALDDYERADDLMGAKCCMICMEERRGCRLHPCLHAALCVTCASHLKDTGRPCPICTKPIEQVEVGTFLKTFALDATLLASIQDGLMKTPSGRAALATPSEASPGSNVFASPHDGPPDGGFSRSSSGLDAAGARRNLWGGLTLDPIPQEPSNFDLGADHLTGGTSRVSLSEGSRAWGEAAGARAAAAQAAALAAGEAGPSSGPVPAAAVPTGGRPGSSSSRVGGHGSSYLSSSLALIEEEAAGPSGQAAGTERQGRAPGGGRAAGAPMQQTQRSERGPSPAHSASGASPPAPSSVPPPAAPPLALLSSSASLSNIGLGGLGLGPASRSGSRSRRPASRASAVGTSPSPTGATPPQNFATSSHSNHGPSGRPPLYHPPEVLIPPAALGTPRSPSGPGVVPALAPSSSSTGTPSPAASSHPSPASSDASSALSDMSGVVDLMVNAVLEEVGGRAAVNSSSGARASQSSQSPPPAQPGASSGVTPPGSGGLSSSRLVSGRTRASVSPGSGLVPHAVAHGGRNSTPGTGAGGGGAAPPGPLVVSGSGSLGAGSSGLTPPSSRTPPSVRSTLRDGSSSRPPVAAV